MQKRLTKKQQALADFMIDISQDAYAAYWRMTLSGDLWCIIERGLPEKYGDTIVDSRDIKRLIELSDICGGWMAWSGDGVVFVPMDEWRARYNGRGA